MSLLSNCRKEPLNIILYDKSPSTIEKYIQGKWRLVYAKGGICSICTFPCNDCYVQFTSDNRINSTGFYTTSDTTSIHWIKDKGLYLMGDSTYLLSFTDSKGGPWLLVVDQIYYDTLILYDNAYDRMFYYHVRIK